MRRTASLTIAALVGLAPTTVLLAPTSAVATGESCRGEAATIVGAEGKGVVGTEGRDVVATNGATDVRTGGGADLVCVTGPPTGDKTVRITVGAGDDVVDGTTSPLRAVRAELGEGADRFEGGNNANTVHAGYDTHSYEDTETDVLIGGLHRDTFESGSRGPNRDVVDLGDGDDHLDFGGTLAPGGSITGGEGYDRLELDLAAGTNVIDNVTGRLTSNGVQALAWTGMEDFEVAGPSPIAARDVEFVGSDAHEVLVDPLSELGTVTIAFGGGSDDYYAGGPPAAGSRIDAGGGSDDTFYLASDHHALDLDLASGQLGVGASSPYEIVAAGFDEAFLFAPEVTLTGTAAGEMLRLDACRGTVLGRGGEDAVGHAVDSLFQSRYDCRRRFDLRGGAGPDALFGSPGRDVLVGGAGADRLDGRPGDDRLVGGGGEDVLLGRPGHDALLGGAAADVILGGRGRNRVDGGPGRDLCRPAGGIRCER